MTATLATLVESEVLSAQTIRLARHIGFLYGEQGDLAIMAAACTVTALSAGSVCFDLEHPEDLHLDTDTDIDWPDPATWIEALRTSAMVALEPTVRDRPLILDGGFVYLTRYWAEQANVVEWLYARRFTEEIPGLDEVLDLFFSGQFSSQRHAAKVAAESGFCVIAGGPGTGKTTAVARILAVLGTSKPQRVILTAPTGRAAARLEQAVQENLAICESIPGSGFSVRFESVTIHRILGLKPWGGADHDSTRPIPADVIVVDEASMLSLHLMALLLDAITDSTRLILLGDPDQLASVEAGAILADIVASDETIPVARLTTTYRFSGDIADLAEAIRLGDQSQALEVLGRTSDQIEWIPHDLDPTDVASLDSIRTDIVDQQVAMIEAGSLGDAEAALRSLDSHRLLLAHRHGVSGVSHWTQVVRQWLHPYIGGSSRWYPGMPILVTRNDDLLGVYNGDSGVIVSHGGLHLALGDPTGIRFLSPDMIQACEPLYASTIHKAQGSQFDCVSVILPDSSASMLSRELFYTAVTRAKSRLRIVGSPATIERAISSRALRASGLASKLADLRQVGADRTTA